MARAQPKIERVDRDDPRVAAYTRVRERDLVGRQGRFIAEGANVIRLLFSERSRFRPESLLVAENRESFTRELDVPSDVPVFSMTQEDMNALAGFPIHRGVLALGVRVKDATLDEMMRVEPAADHEPRSAGRAPPLFVATMGVVNHDNIGGIFRNAAAFGARGVLLDEVTCDPLYRKAIRVSVGGALVVPFCRFSSGKELLKSLHDASIDVLAFSPRGAEELARVRPLKPTCVLLGSEEPGLPEELLASLRTVRIPISRDFDSLNVSVASGIALAMLSREP